MPTFAELQARLVEAQRRKLILEHLIEHIDENFRAPSSGEPAPFTLKDDNNLPVTEADFESFISEVLVPIANECAEEVQHIESMSLSTTPAAAPAPAPVAQEAATEQVTPGKKKGKK